MGGLKRPAGRERIRHRPVSHRAGTDKGGAAGMVNLWQERPATALPRVVRKKSEKGQPLTKIAEIGSIANKQGNLYSV